MYSKVILNQDNHPSADLLKDPQTSPVFDASQQMSKVSPCINRLLFVTWSRGMSRMSEILILSYRLKEVINPYVLHCFWIQRIVCISTTRCPIEIGFGSKCSILKGQVIYNEKSKLNIANMWCFPLIVSHFIYLYPNCYQFYLSGIFIQWAIKLFSHMKSRSMILPTNSSFYCSSVLCIHITGSQIQQESQNWFKQPALPLTVYFSTTFTWSHTFSDSCI